MTDIPDALNRVQQESVEFGSAVSEATLTRIGGTANWLITNAATQLGDVIESMLSLADFQTLRGTNWVKMSGQSIVGSDLNTLSGITTLPNMTSNSAFLRQATSDGTVGTFQNHSLDAHTHTYNEASLSASGGDLSGGGGIADLVQGSVSTGSTGGSETRPINYQVNFFIKIDNE